jgi:hypothetical protein
MCVTKYSSKQLEMATDCSTLLRLKTGRALNAFYQSNRVQVTTNGGVVLEQGMTSGSSGMTLLDRNFGRGALIVNNYEVNSACCTSTTGGGPAVPTRLGGPANSVQ